MAILRCDAAAGRPGERENFSCLGITCNTPGQATNHIMPSANKFDGIIAPPEPSHDIRSGCELDAPFVSQLKPGHIIEGQCPHPHSTENEIKDELPVNADTHVPLSSLVSNPDTQTSVVETAPLCTLRASSSTLMVLRPF